MSPLTASVDNFRFQYERTHSTRWTVQYGFQNELQMNGNSKRWKGQETVCFNLKKGVHLVINYPKYNPFVTTASLLSRFGSSVASALFSGASIMASSEGSEA
jgi:hypothetical protein